MLRRGKIVNGTVNMWYSTSMNATLFFIMVIVGIVGAFWYVNKDDFSEPKETYCARIETMRNEDGEYQISYGQRAKAVIRGCL